MALTLACPSTPGVRLPEPVVLADRVGRDEVKRLWEDADLKTAEVGVES